MDMYSLSYWRKYKTNRHVRFITAGTRYMYNLLSRIHKSFSSADRWDSFKEMAVPVNNYRNKINMHGHSVIPIKHMCVLLCKDYNEPLSFYRRG